MKWKKKSIEYQSNSLRHYTHCAYEEVGKILYKYGFDQIDHYAAENTTACSTKHLNLLYRNRRPTLIERTMKGMLLLIAKGNSKMTPKSIRCGCRERDKRET
mmetsp:Transcript_20111/g.40334  ORF Transcript_20111/g.40334 Transcript_20111/m.40334 type:complete len:102 (-) Transcript_20111:159-464(-)